MNWQTKEIRDWLDEVGILDSQREDIVGLQELVESRLLVHGELSYTGRIKNLAITELLKNVQWEELVNYPKAWDDWNEEDYD